VMSPVASIFPCHTRTERRVVREVRLMVEWWARTRHSACMLVMCVLLGHLGGDEGPLLQLRHALQLVVRVRQLLPGHRLHARHGLAERVLALGHGAHQGDGVAHAVTPLLATPTTANREVVRARKCQCNTLASSTS
jgi:hypothetical protein